MGCSDVLGRWDSARYRVHNSGSEIWSTVTPLRRPDSLVRQVPTVRPAKGPALPQVRTCVRTTCRRPAKRAASVVSVLVSVATVRDRPRAVPTPDAPAPHAMQNSPRWTWKVAWLAAGSRRLSNPLGSGLGYRPVEGQQRTCPAVVAGARSMRATGTLAGGDRGQMPPLPGAPAWVSQSGHRSTIRSDQGGTPALSGPGFGRLSQIEARTWRVWLSRSCTLPVTSRSALRSGRVAPRTGARWWW